MGTRYRKLETAGELQRLMRAHYLEAQYLRLGRPVAWVTSGAPVEILRAMGIVVVYPENYGALCGARRAAVTLCRHAEAAGYSPDLCSYARTSLGAMLDNDQAPMGGLPRPSLLVACNNICGTVIKWYEAVARNYGVPLFVLDIPFIHDQVQPQALDYVEQQLRELIRFVERATHRRLQWDRLEQVVRLSNQTVSLWGEIRAMCRAIPSPLNVPDLFVNMAPIVVLRGTQGAVRFYQHLRDEVAQRVQQGVGAVAEERYRLLWDNIPLWHRLYRFYNEFAGHGACFVVDTYTGAWSQAVPAGDVLGGLAFAYATVMLNQGLEYRAEQMAQLILEYNVDGFVMHNNRSCKPYSLGQYAIKRQVTARSAVPGLVIEADMCDSRSFAPEAVNTRIQAFVEMLAAS